MATRLRTRELPGWAGIISQGGGLPAEAGREECHLRRVQCRKDTLGRASRNSSFRTGFRLQVLSEFGSDGINHYYPA